MKKIFTYGLPFFILASMFFACKDEKQANLQPFDPSKEIKVSGFYPDSGGIATPIIIEGENFGSDTAGMKVYFVDTLGVKHTAGLVSSNGEKIYAMVPKLTYLRRMQISVEREKDGKVIKTGTATDNFFYKTQVAVTTVVGKPEPDNDQVRTVGGDLATARLSAPAFLCLDNEDNIFVVDRPYAGYLGYGPMSRNDKGDAVNGNISMVDMKKQSLVVLKYGTAYVNAPTFSDEENNEAVYMPEDAGLYYYQLPRSLSYAPRRRSLILTPETKDVIEGNWKYSFVVNKNDKMVYTVMNKGQLVRFNPITRTIEVLLNKVIPDKPNISGANISNSFCIFSPIETNMLYMCLGGYNIISRVDVSDLADKDKATYKGEFYAGRSIIDGPDGGKGWEDGLLANARFDQPKQIAFTADGKLYITDTGNHCIRTIDTTVPAHLATVNTAVGLPKNKGFQDGGPEFAKFNTPTGVAVNNDGSVLYVADLYNKVIRKLSIE